MTSGFLAAAFGSRPVISATIGPSEISSEPRKSTSSAIACSGSLVYTVTAINLDAISRRSLIRIGLLITRTFDLTLVLRYCTYATPVNQAQTAYNQDSYRSLTVLRYL